MRSPLAIATAAALSARRIFSFVTLSHVQRISTAMSPEELKAELARPLQLFELPPEIIAPHPSRGHRLLVRQNDRQ
ncbi:hypothetical protein [Delftia tsuruhatensis]|uniref:hypothetical protein n=1 Tax=Delftia tsuruhatensis TaxID=180282 RepID=UPI000A9E60AC|nr:hypothetical protein [Delftia tsuruhatensis]